MRLTGDVIHAAAALMAALLLAACTSTSSSDTAAGPSVTGPQAGSTSMSDAVPSGGATYYTDANAAGSNPRRDRGSATRNATFVEQGASRTNTYPKFVPPHPATTQMTDAEKKTFEAQMAARISANERPAENTAEYQEQLKLMRALAQNHGEQTLEQIRQ